MFTIGNRATRGRVTHRVTAVGVGSGFAAGGLKHTKDGRGWLRGRVFVAKIFLTFDLQTREFRNAGEIPAAVAL